MRGHFIQKSGPGPDDVTCHGPQRRRCLRLRARSYAGVNTVTEGKSRSPEARPDRPQGRSAISTASCDAYQPAFNLHSLAVLECSGRLNDRFHGCISATVAYSKHIRVAPRISTFRCDLLSKRMGCRVQGRVRAANTSFNTK